LLFYGSDHGVTDHTYYGYYRSEGIRWLPVTNIPTPNVPGAKVPDKSLNIDIVLILKSKLELNSKNLDTSWCTRKRGRTA
jgi:hypothetical protein